MQWCICVAACGGEVDLIVFCVGEQQSRYRGMPLEFPDGCVMVKQERCVMFFILCFCLCILSGRSEDGL